MNYLILHNGTAFFTNWFDYENHYADGMTVFNMITHKYTVDGKLWMEITEDTL